MKGITLEHHARTLTLSVRLRVESVDIGWFRGSDCVHHQGRLTSTIAPLPHDFQFKLHAGGNMEWRLIVEGGEYNRIRSAGRFVHQSIHDVRAVTAHLLHTELRERIKHLNRALDDLRVWRPCVDGSCAELRKLP